MGGALFKSQTTMFIFRINWILALYAILFLLLCYFRLYSIYKNVKHYNNNNILQAVSIAICIIEL